MKSGGKTIPQTGQRRSKKESPKRKGRKKNTFNAAMSRIRRGLFGG